MSMTMGSELNWTDRRVVLATAAAAVVLGYVVVRMIVDIVGMVAADDDHSAENARREMGNRTIVEVFAAACTKKWLTDFADIGECVRVPADVLAARSNDAPPDIAAVHTLQAQRAGAVTGEPDIGVWTVTCAVDMQRYNTGPETQFVTWTITLPKGKGPRAVSLPYVRGNTLSAGLDVAPNYRHPVEKTNPAYHFVSKFFTAFLTGSDDTASAHPANPWVIPNSGITTLGTLYTSADVVSLRSSEPTPPPGGPDENQSVHVLATVTASGDADNPIYMQYPLTLRAPTAGKWLVAAIDTTPRISGAVTTPPRRASLTLSA